jgi:hypothetical protein
LKENTSLLENTIIGNNVIKFTYIALFDWDLIFGSLLVVTAHHGHTCEIIIVSSEDVEEDDGDGGEGKLLLQFRLLPYHIGTASSDLTYAGEDEEGRGA